MAAKIVSLKSPKAAPAPKAEPAAEKEMTNAQLITAIIQLTQILGDRLEAATPSADVDADAAPKAPKAPKQQAAPAPAPTPAPEKDEEKAPKFKVDGWVKLSASVKTGKQEYAQGSRGKVLEIDGDLLTVQFEKGKMKVKAAKLEVAKGRPPAWG